MSTTNYPKKLIEVSLPLENINVEATHEKLPGIGTHPRGIHLWWARRPLAAARAVLFAQMVNDPGGERGYKPGIKRQEVDKKREQLFDIIRELVKWENTNNEDVLNRARDAIRESWRQTCELNKGKPGFDPEHLPAFHDPFAGGGAIPLEAQRLGLTSYATDLNPVAVTINKAMIEIPPRFVGIKPVGPIPEGEQRPTLLEQQYDGIQGLAEDVRRYGYWMREEAKKRIGNLYPDVEITEEMVTKRPDLKPYLGKKLTVIAWLWARTVKSPNPRYSYVDVPLVSSFVLSKKAGKEAYVQPIVEGDSYRFEVKIGKPPKEAENGTKLARGAKFKCLMSDTAIDPDYIKTECYGGRGSQKLMAVVLEGNKGRIYISPQESMEEIAKNCQSTWKPETKLSEDRRAFWTPAYGLEKYGDLFTSRQLVALNTFSDLIPEVRAKAIQDAKSAGMPDDNKGLEQGGQFATAYSEAIITYLCFCIDRCLDFNNSIVGWRSGNEKIMNMYSRQAIPMAWDYGECNIMANVVGSFLTNLNYQVACLSKLSQNNIRGYASQSDAQTQTTSKGKIVSTDPPYYDNIGYADLSDFFYVWLRRNLKPIFPSLFATMEVPKKEELVATPYRHGSKQEAETFFLDGMTNALHNLAVQAHPAFPVTIYYAYKASDVNESGVSNTGWETFLEAVIKAGFCITGTWPMRTERPTGVKIAVNALASSIVLVCRRRDENAGTITRREFVTELRSTLEEALSEMMGGSEGKTRISPNDLRQAAIGPGMEVFSKYSAVLKVDGSPVTVSEAISEINQQYLEITDPASADFDSITQFCIAWFKNVQWGIGNYGDAETSTKAMGLTVEHVCKSGVIEASGGKVRLLKLEEYPHDYDPSKDKICSTWEALHHLIRVLMEQGEQGAGRLLAKFESPGDVCHLSYYLYSECEKKGDTDGMRNYNQFISSWEEIQLACDKAIQSDMQGTLL